MLTRYVYVGREDFCSRCKTDVPFKGKVEAMRNKAISLIIEDTGGSGHGNPSR
jgi:hypothetical protein